IVIQRLYLDFRRKLWGKWHPSAEALRLGPVALRLEVLLYRDGLTRAEAVETLRTNHGTEESTEELTRLASRIPARVRVRGASLGGRDRGDPAAARPASEASDPHVTMQGSETAGRCQTAIDRGMEDLPPHDRVVIRLHFEANVSVADIARRFKLDQRKLYRRI